MTLKFKVGDLICAKSTPKYQGRIVEIKNNMYSYLIESSSGDYNKIGDYQSVSVEVMEKNGRLVTKLDKALK